MIDTSARRPTDPRHPTAIAARSCALCGGRLASEWTQVEGRTVPACSHCLAPVGGVAPMAAIEAEVLRRVRARSAGTTMARLTSGRVLAVLAGSAEPMTVAEIAARCDATYGSASRIVRLLSSAGRICRAAIVSRPGERPVSSWAMVVP